MKKLLIWILIGMLGISLIAPASAQLADTPWPMFHHDLKHTGQSPYLGAQTNDLKWGYTTVNWISSSPAIGADGTIYVGSEDKKLYAIKPDGTKKWSFTTGWEIYSSPAIGTDGTIYVGSGDNKLYAIKPDGTEKWSFTTGGGTHSPAIGTDGTIYVGSYDKKLYAIKPDGTEKWNFTTGNWIRSAPAIGTDGTIYVGSEDKKLYAIKPDGTEKWNFTTGSYIIQSSPAIGADGTIYVGSYDRKLYAIKPDGTEKWNFSTGGHIYSSPAIGADGTIYVGSYDNKLYAIKPDGTEKWNFSTGGHIYSSPAIGADGTIYVGSYDNKLYAIKPDGTEKWNFSTGGLIRSSPAIGADGTIYVGSVEDYKLYAIGGISEIVFTTASQTIIAGQASDVITIQTQDASGNPHPVGVDTIIKLTSTSAAGKFSLSASPWADIISVIIPACSSSVSFYYKDTTVGTPTITAAEDPDQGWTDAQQTETITAPTAPYVVSSNAAGIERNTFDLSENVYCYAGNLPHNDPAVNISVVPNKAWSVGDPIGSDVSGGVETVSTDDSGDIDATLIWPASLTAGNYDIIVDLDQDGYLDAGEPVDDVTLGEGFEAIPEFSTIAIPVAAIMGLLFLFSQRRKKEE